MADRNDTSLPQPIEREEEEDGHEEERLGNSVARAQEESVGGCSEEASLEEGDPDHLDSDELYSMESYGSGDSVYTEDEFLHEPERQRRASSRVIAIGLPSDEVEASAGILVPMADTAQDSESESDEEQAQPPPRHLRTPSDANQEAISEVVAEGIAEREHNEKAGVKKATSTESPSTSCRRASSAIYMHKSDLVNAASTDGSPVSTTHKDTSASFSKDVSCSTSVNGSLEEQISEELEAQAGIPVLLPGAFAMEGLEPNTETGYDSGFDDPNENSSEDRVEDIDQSAQETAPRQILPAELHPSYRQVEQRQLVDGEVVSEDGVRERRLLTGRALRGTVAIIAVAVCSAILVAVLLTMRSNDSSTSEGNEPTIPNGWDQVGKDLRGPTADDNERFGRAVSLAIDKNQTVRIAVGMPGWDDGSNQLRVGQTRVFDWDGTDWTLSAEIKGPGVGAEAGSAVALAKNGLRVAVGSPTWEGRGQVQVYQAPPGGTEDGPTEWSVIGSALLGDDSDGGQFGRAVDLSLDGGILAVGAPYLNGTVGDNSGVVRVYQMVNSTWTQLGQDIQGESALDLFGWAVALSADGQRLVVGAIGSDSFMGKVHIFSLAGTQWEKLDQTIYGISAEDRFGHTVCASDDGTIVAVGVNAQGLNPGYVQVFQYDSDNTEYTQLGNNMVGETNFDSFGYSVSLDARGRTVAVGSPNHDSVESDAGQTQVFKYDEGTSSWSQELGEINGSHKDENFGWSVSISSDGRHVASGAPNSNFDGRLFEVGRVTVHEAVGED